ncbi:hypothetical protein DFJ73DRAFT_756671 [Zopfochytrium polystomum]|nr:hypothetical protein DFJ73DRAFT_756671 [Zopfochytrium polystomum]
MSTPVVDYTLLSTEELVAKPGDPVDVIVAKSKEANRRSDKLARRLKKEPVPSTINYSTFTTSELHVTESDLPSVAVAKNTELRRRHEAYIKDLERDNTRLREAAKLRPSSKGKDHAFAGDDESAEEDDDDTSLKNLQRPADSIRPSLRLSMNL